MPYQVCPICNGEGQIPTSMMTTCFETCPTCKGARIIDDVTGRPPGYIPQITSYPNVETPTTTIVKFGGINFANDQGL